MLTYGDVRRRVTADVNTYWRNKAIELEQRAELTRKRANEMTRHRIDLVLELDELSKDFADQAADIRALLQGAT